MSGVVRGWTDSMDDVREILYTKQMHDVDIPVAVVPLDDATLAAMAERMADTIQSRAGVVDLSDDSPDSAYQNEIVVALRAAFGLDTAGA